MRTGLQVEGGGEESLPDVELKVGRVSKHS
jgi:hypothetical protein